MDIRHWRPIERGQGAHALSPPPLSVPWFVGQDRPAAIAILSLGVLWGTLLGSRNCTAFHRLPHKTVRGGGEGGGRRRRKEKSVMADRTYQEIGGLTNALCRNSKTVFLRISPFSRQENRYACTHAAVVVGRWDEDIFLLVAGEVVEVYPLTSHSYKNRTDFHRPAKSCIFSAVRLSDYLLHLQSRSLVVKDRRGDEEGSSGIFSLPVLRASRETPSAGTLRRSSAGVPFGSRRAGFVVMISVWCPKWDNGIWVRCILWFERLSRSAGMPSFPLFPRRCDSFSCLSVSSPSPLLPFSSCSP